MDNGEYFTDCRIKLGKGSFGSVYRGLHKLTGEPVAMKMIEKEETYCESAEKELLSLKKLQHHPNVVQFLDSFSEHRYFWVIIEFCDRGDLESYLKTAEPNLQKKLGVMTECASAISFMHNLTPPVIHRDLKLKNILLKSTGIEDEVTVKICDFGVAKIFEEGEMSELMKTDTGTMHFRAPEFMLRTAEGKLQYTKAVDTYALGLVFQVIINYGNEGKLLDPHTVVERLEYMTIGIGMFNARERGRRYPIIFSIRPGEPKPLPELKALVSHMTGFEPEDRYPMNEVLWTLENLGDKPKVQKDMVEISSVSSSLEASIPPKDLNLHEDLPISALLYTVKSLYQRKTRGNDGINQAFFALLFYITYFMLQIIQLCFTKVNRFMATGDGDNARKGLEYNWRITCMVLACVIVMASLVVYKSVLFLSVVIMKYVIDVAMFGLSAAIIGAALLSSYMY